MAGFGTDIANKIEFKISGPWKTNQPISPPEYLTALIEAYRFRLESDGDLS